MKMRPMLTLALITVSVLAQSAAPPQLQVRILPNKSTYSLAETIIVKSETDQRFRQHRLFPGTGPELRDDNYGMDCDNWRAY
jgi:hypothetical protein